LRRIARRRENCAPPPVRVLAALLGEPAEDVRERARDDPAVDVALGAAGDRERLAAAGLAVREDRAVVPVEHRVDDGARHRLEHRVLRRRHVEDAAEGEGVVLALVVHDRLLALPLELHRDRVLGVVDLEVARRLLARPHARVHVDVGGAAAAAAAFWHR